MLHYPCRDEELVAAVQVALLPIDALPPKLGFEIRIKG